MAKNENAYDRSIVGFSLGIVGISIIPSIVLEPTFAKIIVCFLMLLYLFHLEIIKAIFENKRLKYVFISCALVAFALGIGWAWIQATSFLILTSVPATIWCVMSFKQLSSHLNNGVDKNY